MEALTFKLDLKKCTGFQKVQLGEGHYRDESRREEVMFKELCKVLFGSSVLKGK